jgi:hypothetical protein
MRVSTRSLLAGLAAGAALFQVAAAADLPFKAPPPPAPQRLSGYIEVYTGGARSRDNLPAALQAIFAPPTIDYNGWVLGGAGRGNWWATPNVSIQLDAQAEGTQYKLPTVLTLVPGSNHFSTSDYLAGAHVNWRDSQRGLLGAFAGIGDLTGNALTSASGLYAGARHGVIGLEGQAYWNKVTLYGQAGYDATMDFGNGLFFNGVHQWFVRGTGRYFVDPNLMLEATGEFADGSIQHPAFAGVAIGNTGFNTWLWRLKAEWRPGTMPFSLFATYQGSRSDYQSPSPFVPTGNEIITDNRVMAGVRLYLGQDTLLANDRTGATLDILDPFSAPTSPFGLVPFAQSPIIPVSDIRLKRDIVLVGRRPDGLGIYRYQYLWSDAVYVGVMAQEVALIHPDAVVHGVDGYLRVDYGRLGTRLMTLPQWEAAQAQKL